MAALKPKPKDNEEKKHVVEHRNVWDISTTDSYNSWFLGVDSANEATECFQNQECSSKEENFDLVVKAVQVTLECGLGHRTVPLLLVESTFTGAVKNWTSFMSVTADTTLEVLHEHPNVRKSKLELVLLLLFFKNYYMFCSGSRTAINGYKIELNVL